MFLFELVWDGFFDKRAWREFSSKPFFCIVVKIPPQIATVNRTTTDLNQKVQNKCLILIMLLTFSPVYAVTALFIYLIGRVYTINESTGHFLQYQQAIQGSFYVYPGFCF